MMPDTRVQFHLNMEGKCITDVQKQEVTPNRGAMMHGEMIIGTIARIAMKVCGHVLHLLRE